MIFRDSIVRLGFALLVLVGCSKNEAPDTPKCKNGIRNQCIDEAAIGSQFGCALLADRTVWCWGRNDQGQLGYNTTDLCPEDIGGGKTRAVACHTFPFQVPGLDGVTAVASGEAFSCAIVGDGSVRCWGGNSQGELGNGKNVTSQTPVQVDSVANATALALGTHHACALADGRVTCWGANDHGQLGVTTTKKCKVDNGIEIDCATKAVPLELTNVVSISAGAQHTCALTGDQRVICWGDNHWGQLGIGTAGEPAPIDPDHDAGDDAGGGGDADPNDGGDAAIDAGPTGPNRSSVQIGPMEMLANVVSISAGSFHTCALRDGGDVLCWGRDDHDELGGPPPATGAMGCPGLCSAFAAVVPDLRKTIEPPEDAGADDATVDATTDDASTEAGDETGSSADAALDSGPADTGASSSDAGPPQGVFGRVLTSGDSYSCLRVGDGTVRCWGADTVGQLGDGRTTNDPRGATLVIAAPGAASNNPLQGAARVRAGSSSVCAIMSDDSLRCWGTNQNGALGVGHFTPQQGPVPVSW